MTERKELIDLRNKLAVARNLSASAKQVVDDLLTTVRNEHAELFSKADIAKQYVEKYEEQLREAAVAYFATTEDKHPVVGVNINDTTVIEYDSEAALEWAKRNSNLRLLKLDDTAFKGLAKSKARPDDMPVTVREEPKAVLGRKLEVGNE